MLHICKYGHPILRLKACPVGKIDHALAKLADAMVELMLQKNGVGLAAQQVGEQIRIFTMYIPPEYDIATCPPVPEPGSCRPGSSAREPDAKRLNPEINAPLVVVNPVISERKGKQVDKEGCLSIPEVFEPVRRAYEISLAFMDLKGKEHQVNMRGLMARVVQHELDHLDGVLFVDRLSALKKIAVAARLKKLKRAVEKEMNC